MQLRKAAAAVLAGSRARRAAGLALPLLLAAGGAAGQGPERPQTTFEPVSAYGASQNAVFMNTFWWTMGILVLVVVLTLYVAWRFRERPDSPEPKHIHGHTGLEITWTLIPALIVVLIAIPTIRTIFENQRRAPEGALQVEVIGHQWWWEFRYPEYGVATANQLYIPVGRPIDLKMHSADVIHSFWIPRIGGKRDVNPQAKAHEGENPSFNHIVFTVDSAGHYLGQCAEYCGDSHAIMRMSVMAVEEAEFGRWVEVMRRGDVEGNAPVQPVQTVSATQAGPMTRETPTGVAQARPGQATPAEAEGVETDRMESVGTQLGDSVRAARAARPLDLARIPSPTGIGSAVQPPVTEEMWAAEGRRLFTGKTCAACHAIQGTTAQGAIGPNLTRFGARPSIGAGALDNNLENLVRWIRNPQQEKPGTLMPGVHVAGGNFPPTALTDTEVHAIAQYLLSLK